MQYIHLGILQVRIQILHRQREGTMALIIFRDNRWQGDQTILATMEVDLTQGSQMIYVIPETMLTIGDCFRNIQISILTKGYEARQNGDANLLITRGLVGRLSNTPNVGFAYEIQGVVDYLTTHGVKALPGRSLSTQRLQGLNWVIKPTQVIIPMKPSEVNSNNLMDGRISLSFHNYIATQTSQQPIYNERDEEIQNQELIAVLIEKADGVFEEVDNPTNLDTKDTSHPYLLVHKLSPYVVIPFHKTSGAAGFDIAASEECVIPPRGRRLIRTGLSMEIPWGTYGRIATRSSAAFKLGLDVGAGVVDSDYRGEIKILAFNHSDRNIYIHRGDCVAQLILEYIVMTNVYEIQQSLTSTDRSTEGFVLASQRRKSTCSSKASKGRWDTLGEPSGKYDYYVNYDIPAPLPDLELPAPSWDDEPTKPQTLNLPKEAATVLIEESELLQTTLEQAHAGETSPGVTVLWSLETTPRYSDMEDAFLDHIQYMASITTPWTTPIWDSYSSDSELQTNPFTTEGDGETSHLLVAGCEMEYPRRASKVEEVMASRSILEQHQVTSTPLFKDQIREYRRNQRRLHNTRQAARRISRRLTGRKAPNHTLEQQIDPLAELQLSMQERASLVSAEVLYHSRRDDANHRVYVHRSEEAILVTDGNQVNRRFIQEESFNQLQRSNMQYKHLGILQVHKQIHHRQREGTMSLIVLRDNRWQGDQAIPATMEVGLTQGS
ncbi:hypothetical protein ZIOFF_068133 [Zingiber officinale]|uniref:dUTP diphosphatase n=1 Tax=Zingiber officinale TaxID=94328 RepID=A0A8J5CGL9_ZINOF|nr:hypothetical protein ZIOFF_068133 [Zingiber officinale]